MRIILSLVLYAGILAAVGCGRSEQGPIKEATAEDIRMQQEAQTKANADESQRRNRQPQEMTHQQSVADQERARRR
ncbi:MAG TPA: hypothetical protein VMG10_01625 [Gemmataceae bacterium]|nr:hypothetical protein [Gemmataceae bacterium]